MQNIKELRHELCENYQLAKEKKMDLKTLKELVNTAGKIINTCKVEAEYNQFLGLKRRIDFLESTDSKVPKI